MEHHNISAGTRCTVKNRKQFKGNFSLILEKEKDEESIKQDFSNVINLMSNFKGVSYFFPVDVSGYHET